MPDYSLFDYINSINDQKYIFDEETYIKKNYNQFVINTAFSYFHDTVFIVNECNILPNMTDKQHYDFLFNMIKKKKRYSKWHKKDKIDDIKVISDYYNISHYEAKQYSEILTKEQIDFIRNIYGGKGG